MSLGDELTKEVKHRIKPTDMWIDNWYSKLSSADKKTWDEWIAEPTRSAAAMFRTLQGYGFPGRETSVREYVRKRRYGTG